MTKKNDRGIYAAIIKRQLNTSARETTYVNVEETQLLLSASHIPDKCSASNKQLKPSQKSFIRHSSNY